MGLFDGLFPAARESQSVLFSADSLFRRHAPDHDGTSKKSRNAASGTDLLQSSSEQQVTEKRKRKASSVEGTTEESAPAGVKSAALGAAISAKGRKRKAEDAASEHAAPLEPSAGAAAAQPAKKKKKKAETSSQHVQQQTAAAEPQSSAPKRKAPLKGERKAGKKAHMAVEDSSEIGPSGTFQGSDSQPAGEQTAQASKSTASGIDDAEAEAVDGEGDMEGEMEGDMSADEAADVADQAAQTAGGAAAAKPKLTEEQRQERLQRTVFVGNLPAAVKAKRLKQAFSQFGAVESVRLRSLPLKEGLKMPRKAAIASGNVDAERAPAHAYIVFGSRASAVYALQLNMTEFEGRHIRVDLAAGVSKSIRGGGKNVLYDSGKSVFLGNLPFDVVEEDLIKLFGGGRGAGSVSAVRVVRDAKSNKGKGIAYVEFQTRNDARMALGFDGHTLNGRAIRVSKIAAGPSAAEQQHGDSKLRTPYSKGVKPGRSFGAGRGRDSMAQRGAPARPGAAAWQGMRTKGQSKLVKGSAAKPRDVPAPEGAKGSGQKAAQQPGKGKRVGKRPAVAARKAGPGAGAGQKKGRK